MIRFRLVGLVGAIVAVAGSLGGIAPSEASELHTKIYLLGGEDGAAYWGVDPSDPELSDGAISRRCGQGAHVSPDTNPCSSLLFMPGSAFAGKPLGGGPIRFHIEMDVFPAAPLTVTVRVQEDTSVSEGSGTQVSPGVWEGTILDSTPFGGTVNLVTIDVGSASPEYDVTIRSRGASWLELPAPFAAHSVPELVQADGYHPAPKSFTGGTRMLRFNDDQWASFSFEGVLDETRTFDLDLGQKARTLIAWVDVFDTPILYDALKGREPDPNELKNSPRIELLRDGEVLASGTNGGYRGRGQDALATFDVSAGPVTIEVSDRSFDPDGTAQALPYRVFVVAAFGERTIAGMHWTVPALEDFSFPLIASCQYGLEPVPVSRYVTTFKVTLDWDTTSVLLPDWTIRYDLPTVGDMVCGNIGSRQRFTVDVPERVWLIGMAPEAGSTYFSNEDTLFDFDVTYTYAQTVP